MPDEAKTPFIKRCFMAKKKTTNASKAAPIELATADCVKHVLRIAISTGSSPNPYFAETILRNYVPMEALTAVVKLSADGLQIERTYVSIRTGGMPAILVLLGDYVPMAMIELESLQGVPVAVEVMAEAADMLPFAASRAASVESLVAAAVQVGITAWENSSAGATDAGEYEEVEDAVEESPAVAEHDDDETAPFDSDEETAEEEPADEEEYEEVEVEVEEELADGEEYEEIEVEVEEEYEDEEYEIDSSEETDEEIIATIAAVNDMATLLQYAESVMMSAKTVAKCGNDPVKLRTALIAQLQKP